MFAGDDLCANLSLEIQCSVMRFDILGELMIFYQFLIYFIPSHCFSVELFSQYVTQRDQSGMPKEFADCQKLYSECEVPKRTIVTRRRKVNRKNLTSTPATSNEETTNEPSGDETSNLI